MVGIYFDAGSSPPTHRFGHRLRRCAPSPPTISSSPTLVQTDVLDAMNAQGWAIPDEGVLTDGARIGPEAMPPSPTTDA